MMNQRSVCVRFSANVGALKESIVVVNIDILFTSFSLTMYCCRPCLLEHFAGGRPSAGRIFEESSTASFFVLRT